MLSALADDRLEKVSKWYALNKHYTEPYRGEEDIYDQEEEREAIMRPVTSTMPMDSTRAKVRKGFTSQ
jgi:hypothetical protein